LPSNFGDAMEFLGQTGYFPRPNGAAGDDDDDLEEASTGCMRHQSPKASSHPEAKSVGFEQAEKPHEEKRSILEDVMARYAAAHAEAKARAKAAKQGRAKPSAESSEMGAMLDFSGWSQRPHKAAASSSGEFSKPSRWQSLDTVKLLPKQRGSAKRHSLSGSRYASGSRSVASVSAATTSLTVRSAVQIREDRSFKEGFHQPVFDTNAERVKLLDLAPQHQDPGGGGKDIGTHVERKWRGQLRETCPNGSKGDPVARNALSKDAMQVPATPGLFSQIPELLGRWREDFSGWVDASTGKLGAGAQHGAAQQGAVRGQWVPESLVRERDRQLLRAEAKAKEDRLWREREERQERAQEEARREAAARLAKQRVAQELEAKEQAVREEAERLATRQREEKKKRAVIVPSCLRRAVGSARSGGRAAAGVGAGSS